MVYLDDILFVSYMPARRTRQLIRLLQYLFQLFGLTIHSDKSILTPCSSVEFLGYTIYAEGRMVLTSRRLNKIRATASKLLGESARNRRFV